MKLNMSARATPWIFLTLYEPLFRVHLQSEDTNLERAHCFPTMMVILWQVLRPSRLEKIPYLLKRLRLVDYFYVHHFMFLVYTSVNV